MHRAFEPVARGLAHRIVEGRYAPGARLPTEADLQVEWGVSRAVVREAMKTLASQGLVRIEQGRGTFVNDNMAPALGSQIALMLRRGAPESTVRDEWAHLSDVRRVLEVAVAERAARYAKSKDIAALQATVATMRTRAGDRRAYVEADIAFHRALAEATANPLWPALLNSLNDLLRTNRLEGYRAGVSAERAADEHQEILNAVKAQQPQKAVAAMQRHLRRSDEDLHG